MSEEENVTNVDSESTPLNADKPPDYSAINDVPSSSGVQLQSVNPSNDNTNTTTTANTNARADNSPDSKTNDQNSRNDTNDEKIEVTTATTSVSEPGATHTRVTQLIAKHKNDTWYLSIDDIKKYHQFFEQANVTNSGIVSGIEAKKFFLKSKLDGNTLSQVWGMCSDHRGALNESRFYAMFHMVLKLKQSEQDSKLKSTQEQQSLVFGAVGGGRLSAPATLPECLKFDVIETFRLHIEKNNNMIDEIERREKERLRQEEEARARRAAYNPFNYALRQRRQNEPTRLEKRAALKALLDMNDRVWYFEDVLGIKQGAYTIEDLTRFYRSGVLTGSMITFKNGERHKNEKLSSHGDLWRYLCTFDTHSWYYLKDSDNSESGPHSNETMKRYVFDGQLNEFTRVRRDPPLLENEMDVGSGGGKERPYWVPLNTTNEFKLWHKRVLLDQRKSEGYVILDTGAMFLHNLCYYYFAYSLYMDKKNGNGNDGSNTLDLLFMFSLALCVLESIVISLMQFEIKEKIIPYSNELIPIGIFQTVFEYFVNLPMVIIFIYYCFYYYYFDGGINYSVYICFAAYILLCIYKVISCLGGHYDRFYSYRMIGGSSIKQSWKFCIAMHVCNWAICVPAVLITFGGIYLNKKGDEFKNTTLPIVCIVIGCVWCCCMSCAGKASLS